MFFGPTKENEVIEMGRADANAFKEFLQFFYLTKITLSVENIQAVVQYAIEFKIIEDMFKMCSTFIKGKVTKQNVVWSYQLATLVDNDELKQICERQIRTLSSNIFKSNILNNCNQEVIQNILQFDELLCNEFDLFNACIEWAKSMCQKNG